MTTKAEVLAQHGDFWAAINRCKEHAVGALVLTGAGVVGESAISADLIANGMETARAGYEGMGAVALGVVIVCGAIATVKNTVLAARFETQQAINAIDIPDSFERIG